MVMNPNLSPSEPHDLRGLLLERKDPLDEP
jgi:hypothetical protein